VVLNDDKGYFPPYYAAPLIRKATMDRYPQLATALNKLAGSVNDDDMSALNLAADQGSKTPREVATAFLTSRGFPVARYSGGRGQVIVGSKNFTESFILAELLKILIENQTSLNVDLKLGFGGTKLLFDAMVNGDVDLYAEYTGTGLLVLLPDEARNQDLVYNAKMVYEYVKYEFEERYDLIWLDPLGFNNTHAIIMRRTHAQELGVNSISDLSAYMKTVE